MGTKRISQLSPNTNPSLTGVTVYDDGQTTYQLSLGTLKQTLVDGQSHNFSGSQVISGSLSVTSAVTASAFVGDGHGLSNLPITVSGTTPHIAFFNSPTSVTSSDNFHAMREGNTLALGTMAYNQSNPERLMVDNGNNPNIATFQTSVLDGPANVNIINFSTGSDASAGLSLHNDYGVPSSSYVRLSINSSTNNSMNVGFSGDASLVNYNNDLYIGSLAGLSHGHVHIFSGRHTYRPSISCYGDRTIGFNMPSLDTGSLQTIPSSVNGFTYEFSGSAYLKNDVLIDGYTVLSNVSQSLNFTNDSDAASAGVPLGGLYRNGNSIQIRIV